MLKILLKHAIAEKAIDSFFNTLKCNFNRNEPLNFLCYGNAIQPSMVDMFVTVYNDYLPPVKGIIKIDNTYHKYFAYLVDVNTGHELGVFEDDDKLYY